MTIGKKIGLSTGSLIAVSLAVGVVGWTALNEIGGKLDEAMNDTTRKIERVGELKLGVMQFRLAERGFVLFSLTNAPEKARASLDSFDQTLGQTLDKVAEIRSHARTARGRQTLDKVKAAISEYRDSQQQVRQLAAAGKVQESLDYDQTLLVPVGARIAAAVDEYAEVLRGTNGRVGAAAAGTRRQAQWLFVAGLLTSLCIGIVVVFVILRITRELKAVAVGLHETAGQMATASAQVASSSQSLAQGSSEQAASLEETSASSVEINSMAHNNSERSRSALDLVAASQQKFADTNVSLQEMQLAMDNIKASSEKVSQIIKLIDAIAFQTNILALNAAVEAARAGEAGAGFAVVADEVRNLAQRCAQAAKDTAGLIDESLAKADDGKSKVDHVVQEIQVITRQSGEIKGLIDEVNAGSQEQANGLEQITRAIAQIEQVTQSTAAAAEESASASEALTSNAETLRGAVRSLTAMVGNGE